MKIDRVIYIRSRIKEETSNLLELYLEISQIIIIKNLL